MDIRQLLRCKRVGMRRSVFVEVIERVAQTTLAFLSVLGRVVLFKKSVSITDKSSVQTRHTSSGSFWTNFEPGTEQCHSSIHHSQFVERSREFPNQPNAENQKSNLLIFPPPTKYYYTAVTGRRSWEIIGKRARALKVSTSLRCNLEWARLNMYLPIQPRSQSYSRRLTNWRLESHARGIEVKNQIFCLDILVIVSELVEEFQGTYYNEPWTASMRTDFSQGQTDGPNRRQCRGGVASHVAWITRIHLGLFGSPAGMPNGAPLVSCSPLQFGSPGMVCECF